MGLRVAIGGPPVFSTDDAYIAIHAARHLFTGIDPSYPEGAGLVGVTSPLHVFALWVVMRVLPPLWAAEALGWVGAAFYLFGAATFICFHLKSRWEQVMAMTVAVLAGYTSQHLASGQETAWAMGAVVWSMHFVLMDPPNRRRAAMFAAVLPWLRPELLLWSAAILWRLRRAERSWLLRAVAAVGVSVGCYVLTNRLGGGSWLPNTIEAKRVFFAEYGHRADISLGVGVIFLANWIWQFGPVALALVAALAGNSTALATRVFFFMWVGLSLNGPGAFEHNFFRYAQPFALPAILAGLCGGKTWIRRPLLVLSVAWCLVCVPNRWASFQSSVATATRAQADIATWLNANAAAGSKVLVHDAGYLSEATGLQLVDLVGLKTPSSTAWHKALTGPSNGMRRGEAVRGIACQAAPTYFVAFSHWENVFDLTRALSQSGWAAVPIMRRRVIWPDVSHDFTLYRLIVPPGCPPAPRR